MHTPGNVAATLVALASRCSIWVLGAAELDLNDPDDVFETSGMLGARELMELVGIAQLDDAHPGAQ